MSKDAFAQMTAAWKGVKAGDVPPGGAFRDDSLKMTISLSYTRTASSIDRPMSGSLPQTPRMRSHLTTSGHLRRINLAKKIPDGELYLR